MTKGPGDTIQFTPQELDEWRLNRDINSMVKQWWVEPPQGLSMLARPPMRSAYNRKTDMRPLPNCDGFVRERHGISQG